MTDTVSLYWQQILSWYFKPVLNLHTPILVISSNVRLHLPSSLRPSNQFLHTFLISACMLSDLHILPFINWINTVSVCTYVNRNCLILFWHLMISLGPVSGVSWPSSVYIATFIQYRKRFTSWRSSIVIFESNVTSMSCSGNSGCPVNLLNPRPHSAPINFVLDSLTL